MNSVRAILPSDAVVTVPTIHYFDDVAHVVIMDDCGVGGVTLKQLMLENPPPVSVAKALGAGLGEFLSRLHVWGRDPQTSNHASFDQNQHALAHAVLRSFFLGAATERRSISSTGSRVSSGAGSWFISANSA